jgi:hypothetical protein
MPARNIARQATVPGVATAKAAPIYVDADDNIVKVIPAGSGTTEVQMIDASSTQTLTNKTLTAPAITGALTVGAGATLTGPAYTELTEAPALANILTAAESGKTLFINSATGFAHTLPAVAAGLYFKFVVALGPTSGNHTIVAASGTPIVGHVLTTDVNSATDPSFSATGVLTITLVANKAVKGDSVELCCDGTNWYATARCSVFDAITFS